MKKLMTIALMMVAMTVSAQEMELNENGAYERKEVVMIDGTSAATLYDRAMIALSDWTGSDGHSKAGIDYSERDAGVVIYKGNYFIEKKSGVSVTADFTMKVRCKDGKAQITVTISSLTADAPSIHRTKTRTIAQVVEGKKKNGQRYVSMIPDIVNTLRQAMSDKLKNSSDDDF